MEEKAEARRKSPVYVDLYGKRSHQAKLHLLESEISILQEELKSLEGAQPTSRCCKELNEFLAAKSDPLITINQKAPKSSDCSWKSLSGCCQSENARCCCCCCSGKCSCFGSRRSKKCSCIKQKCCCFKLSCSASKCCKVKLCSSCVMSSRGSCCL